MAKTTMPDTVVVVDDELQNVMWMFDFFDSKKMYVSAATNVNEALITIDKEIYRAIIVDLNIPVLEPLSQAVRDLGNVYTKYPGLYVARIARNHGYRDRQIIIYSVHKDAEVAEEAKRLGCSYILKGRPKEIKEELEAVLSFDPTAD
jgi:CheY-like chemotaxis protein